jgi:hypothetical protein
MTIPSSELKEIIQRLRSGQKEEASELLRQVLRQNPNNVRALIWLGGLTTNMREGIIALERALKLDPGNETAELYLDRLRALQVGGRLVARWSNTNAEELDRLRNHKMAILIDGENAQPALMRKILVEARKYGSLHIRRIYGDWTKPGMNGWKKVLQTYAIQPIQQFQYTTGKNASDSALIIDAMDILHAGLVDGFCLVSSDSDFTRLATRISESGIFVMGIGKQRTPGAFVNACDIFIYTETLMPEANSDHSEGALSSRSVAVSREQEIVNLLGKAFDEAAQPNGRAYLGTLGIHLQRIDPSFEPRKYGFKQLSQLIKAYPKHFEMETISSKVYVKMKGHPGPQNGLLTDELQAEDAVEIDSDDMSA